MFRHLVIAHCKMINNNFLFHGAFHQRASEHFTDTSYSLQIPTPPQKEGKQDYPITQETEANSFKTVHHFGVPLLLEAEFNILKAFFYS